MQQVTCHFVRVRACVHACAHTQRRARHRVQRNRLLVVAPMGAVTTARTRTASSLPASPAPAPPLRPAAAACTARRAKGCAEFLMASAGAAAAGRRWAGGWRSSPSRASCTHIAHGPWSMLDDGRMPRQMQPASCLMCTHGVYRYTCPLPLQTKRRRRPSNACAHLRAPAYKRMHHAAGRRTCWRGPDSQCSALSPATSGQRW